MMKTMSDYIPNPANYTMKGNANPPVVQAQEAPDIDKLEGMTRDELIALVRLCNAEQIAIAGLTEDQIAEAMLFRIASDGLTSKDAKRALENFNAWLDRVKGKAPTVQVNTQNNSSINISVVRFTDDD